MDGRYLLDTNIVIAELGSDTQVLDRIGDADECFISSTVLGEMLFGALNSSNSAVNVERLRTFIAGATFLGCDERTAFVYGEIKTKLRQIGKPIPDNDIWIAASVQQHSLTLVTRDAHFEEISGLHRIRW